MAATASLVQQRTTIPPQWRPEARERAENYAVGIDVGHTRIAAGVVHLRSGRILHQIHEPSPNRDGSVLRTCVELAEHLGTVHRVGYVGVAIPDEAGDDQTHTTDRWDWRDAGVAALFAAVAPATVQPAVHAAAFGEASTGAGRGLDCFIYVSIATTIKAVVVRHGMAWDSPLGTTLAFGVQSLTGSSGARVADAAIARLGEEIGRAVSLIEPDAVIVGGEFGLDPRLRRRWVDVMRESQCNRPAALVPVVEAEFKSEAPLVGAALAAGWLLDPA
jgi:predicted NBD/HSP70 family sugar kinase